jgi:hypothetical protein
MKKTAHTSLLIREREGLFLAELGSATRLLVEMPYYTYSIALAIL